MWADNETDVDLLGYDYLLDSLFVALTEPRLLPLTVGVLGDWGSGKSSLLKMAERELKEASEEKSGYITVTFSPWQYEDYDDVKVALMNAVISRLADEVKDDAGRSTLGLLRRFVNGLRGRTAAWGRAALVAAPSGVPLAAHALDPGIDPNVVMLAQGVTKAGVDKATAKGQESGNAGGSTDSSGGAEELTEINEFRSQFAGLLTSLTGIKAVVVFIDDLDRCLPESVVDTFEAIRLFLNAPKCAYVVAANQAVVESAIDSRYPELRKPDGSGLGADYLEKMLQLKVAIPALSVPEAETYANLLLAELRLSTDEFDRVIAETKRRRAAGHLTVVFNTGVASEILPNVPAALADDLQWMGSIAPTLARGLRGNPRQIKRFLNTLLLRKRAAARRTVDLRGDVLGKLMLLEEQHFLDFQRLFEWQVRANAPSPELAAAEERARRLHNEPESLTAPDTGVRNDAAKASKRRAARDEKEQVPPESAEWDDWAKQPHIQEWLLLEPALGAIDLGPYFTYSRDKLSPGAVASRLAPHLQELLTALRSEIAGVRRANLARLLDLPEGDQMHVVDALLTEITRTPGIAGNIEAAIELADRLPSVLDQVVRVLSGVPPSTLSYGVGLAAVRRLPIEDQGVSALLDKWSADSSLPVAKAISVAKRASTRRN